MTESHKRILERLIRQISFLKQELRIREWELRSLVELDDKHREATPSSLKRKIRNIKRKLAFWLLG